MTVDCIFCKNDRTQHIMKHFQPYPSVLSFKNSSEISTYGTNFIIWQTCDAIILSTVKMTVMFSLCSHQHIHYLRDIYWRFLKLGWKIQRSIENPVYWNSRNLPSNSEILLGNHVKWRRSASIVGIITQITNIYCYVTKEGGLVLDGEEHLLKVLILLGHN